MGSISSFMAVNGQAIIQILLIILLVLAIWLVIRLIILLGHFNKVGQKLNNSMDMVNDYLGELKLPIRALVNVSMSIEALRAASEAQLKLFFDKISENLTKIMEMLKQIWHSITDIKKESKQSKEPDVVVESATPEPLEPITSETSEQKGE